MAEALSCSISPITLYSLVCPEVQVRAVSRPDGTQTYQIMLQPNLWAPADIDWLVRHGYHTRPPEPDDEGVFDMNGLPISSSVKAVEATPKMEPPLFEERDV